MLQPRKARVLSMLRRQRMANRGTKYRYKKQILKMIVKTRKEKKKEGDKYGK